MRERRTREERGEEPGEGKKARKKGEKKIPRAVRYGLVSLCMYTRLNAHRRASAPRYVIRDIGESPSPGPVCASPPLSHPRLLHRREPGYPSRAFFLPFFRPCAPRHFEPFLRHAISRATPWHTRQSSVYHLRISLYSCVPSAVFLRSSTASSA